MKVGRKSQMVTVTTSGALVVVEGYILCGGEGPRTRPFFVSLLGRFYPVFTSTMVMMRHGRLPLCRGVGMFLWAFVFLM